ncbi:MAG: hypothetical protein CMM73_03355 [Rhodospirillaceae bacterium]|nr:hypothetical protein [Rhodospirillaceae bacterium]
MINVAIIVLAAGKSRRMGHKNKLLLDFGGEALLRRTVRMLAGLQDAEVTVVLGHAAQETADVIRDLDVTVTVNPDYNMGQRSSVFHGLSKAGTAAAYLVTPADMPRLESDHCSALLKAHETAPAGSITLPVGDRSSAFERGNPVILTPQARDNVLRGGINLGCRGLLDSEPELINSFVTACDGYFIDIDTPEIYQAEYSIFMAGSGQPTAKEHTHGIE